MAVNYSPAHLNAKATFTRDACADGSLQILTAGGAVLVTFGLSASGGSVANGVWTLAFDNATVAAAASGTATQARIRNSSGVDVITGLTVGVDTGVPANNPDIVIQNTSINSGQNVTMTSATLTER